MLRQHRVCPYWRSLSDSSGPFTRPFTGYTRVCVFSDCQVLVRAICSKSSPVELYGLVCEIELLSSLFDYCTLSFISRSLNLEADLLAKSALFNAALTT
ncbi:unnamed protein product [Brassica oleracea var. botrytis]|uniref:RNase H type-1 domain-containing protein n=1 Tax=Brassica oleracea TaxID=3712 RepID=A0A3P6G218_BRAOL|nr:unnamed protein product [Brassica oleracea]